MIKNLNQPLKIQGIIGLIAVVIFATQGQLWSSVYGLFIGMMNVLMLSVTFKKADQKAAEDPKFGILVLYLSAVVRFILLAVLFVLGLALFKFEPMAVVLTFVVMQIGQMFNLKGKRRLTD
ncbi:ATP synthase subunit I [Thiomicrorhabdus sp. ZW0627]|uniref:ATP synthase subunit I n=1 Tax=Thiomicrorhabdus sp. ZW0627 TaxID=3039774 RepID=UPI0024372E49|nr:ATP synthase subunit I [Thiomicrorhabdus sp. ZW0627]MDG6774279.1 ATP synthase subunit I [Thiomicrorhabdus sp. ZW0627]